MALEAVSTKLVKEYQAMFPACSARAPSSSRKRKVCYSLVEETKDLGRLLTWSLGIIYKALMSHCVQLTLSSVSL